MGHNGTNGVEVGRIKRLEVTSELGCPMLYIGPNNYWNLSSLIWGLAQDYVHVKKKRLYCQILFQFEYEAFHQ